MHGNSFAGSGDACNNRVSSNRRPEPGIMTSETTGEQEVPISHLQRRKIEGRVLIPFIEACRERFGEEATRDLVVSMIRRLAAGEGAQFAQRFGRGLAALKRITEDVWAGGGAMDVDMIEATADRLDFNVMRCGYAAFYQELGLTDIGALVHCSRDHAMAAAFDPGVELVRTGTIMEGKPCCDFRFRRKPPAPAGD
jgi:L-2-amino-thiazoline-4-carboxylic acid hydrolase